MVIHPGDPRERFGARRRLLQALSGLLFLPAQGVFLATALRTQTPVAWIGWVVVLTSLIATAVVWIRDRRFGDLTVRPWTPGPLLPVEVAALVLGLLVRAGTTP